MTGKTAKRKSLIIASAQIQQISDSRQTIAVFDLWHVLQQPMPIVSSSSSFGSSFAGNRARECGAMVRAWIFEYRKRPKTQLLTWLKLLD